MSTSLRMVVCGLTAATCLFLPQLSHGDELSRAAMLGASCEGCHGTNGRSEGVIPAIAGKSVEFLREALSGFRSGERPATVMDRHMKGYTEEEIRLLAEHFSRQ